MIVNKFYTKTLLILSLLPGLVFSAPLEPLATPQPETVMVPTDQKLYDQFPWMLTYYYGITGTNALMRIVGGEFNRWPEHIQSVELAKTLDEDNFLRRLVNRLCGVVQLAGDVTIRTGTREPTIYEFDPYIGFRWANLPWNNYLTTSLAIGEGVSYASSVPSVEKRNNQNTKRFLNFLMLEATFAAPQYPQLQLVARIHHRSGAFGLYHAGNTGSNVIGLGIRYVFA